MATAIKKDEAMFKLFKKAEKFGWKKWGYFTKKKGSSYQCFRKGNLYCWIGFRFIEIDGISIQYARHDGKFILMNTGLVGQALKA